MSSNLPPFASVVVAAGKGLRVGGETPKQYRDWRGKPLVRHSIESLANAGANPMVVVVTPGTVEIAEASLEGLRGIAYVEGGDTRQESVFNGLLALEKAAPERVLIQDAARPDLPQEVVARLVEALEQHEGAIPVLPVVDSLAIAQENGMMGGSADRESLKRVQTPQAFRYADILTAHKKWAGAKIAGDDAQVLAQNGGTIALVAGDERLKKVTFAEDFEVPAVVPFRVGQGFDVHRLVDGEELWLCGMKIEHEKGLAGHSDADVALHAITDAILGAIGDGDIGTHFPPSDPQWKGARSDRFLRHAIRLAKEAGYSLSNLDVTIICEAPKIGPHRDAMRASVSEMTGASINDISIKATTTERLGFTGREEGVAAQAIVGLAGANG